MTYEEWLAARTSEDPSVKGGSRVFVGTRLPVASVGNFPQEYGYELLEDYPYLLETDLVYARRYAENLTSQKSGTELQGSLHLPCDAQSDPTPGEE